jgi:hypothetical protein
LMAPSRGPKDADHKSGGPRSIDLPALPIVAFDCPAELEKRRARICSPNIPSLAHNLRTRDCRVEDNWVPLLRSGSPC